MKAADFPQGTRFVQVRHDAWCRAQYTQSMSVCNAVVVEVDRDTWLAGVAAGNRAARRRAEREARRKGGRS